MARASTAARPARFDEAAKHRRLMLGKIHVAKRDIAIDEDDYRQLLFDATGKLSLTECSEPQLAKVIDALKAKGFRPKLKKGAADHRVAMKARALWISLYHLGVVHNPAEEALEAFAARQVKCEKLKWMRQSQGYQLIEALKGMAENAGWHQRGRRGEQLGPIGLNEALCEAILVKLKEARAIPTDWPLHMAAWRLLGIANDKADPWTAEDYHRLAEGFGRALREATGGRNDA